jgi:hypothetical protein
MDQALLGTLSAASIEAAAQEAQDPETRGDPRMNRAVQAKLNKPHIALTDALRIGGFEYPPKATASAVDSDNVTLGQRKNQLNRRLRQARLNQAAGLERSSMEQTTAVGQSIQATADANRSSELDGNGNKIDAVRNFTAGNKRPSSPAADLAQQPSTKIFALPVGYLDSALPQSLTSTEAAHPALTNLTQNSVMYNSSNATVPVSAPPDALSDALSSQVSQQLLEQLYHMQSLQQSPPVHMVQQLQQQLQQQEQQQHQRHDYNAVTDILQQLTQWPRQQQPQQKQPQQQRQSSNTATDLLQQLTQWPKQQQPQQQQQSSNTASDLLQQLSQWQQQQQPQQQQQSILEQLQTLICQQPLGFQQRIAAAPSNAAGNNANQLDLAQLLFHAPAMQDTAPLPQPTAATTLNNVSANGSVAHCMISLPRRMSSHNNSVTSSIGNATRPGSVGGSSTNGSLPGHLTVSPAVTSLGLTARSNSSGTTQTTTMGGSTAPSGHPADETATDHRLQIALLVFERDIRQLYQQSMLQAGFSIQDCQETTQAYHNFAFHAWRRECKNLQRLLQRDFESANNPIGGGITPSDAVSAASSAGGNAVGYSRPAM